MAQQDVYARLPTSAGKTFAPLGALIAMTAFHDERWTGILLLPTNALASQFL